MSVRFYPVYPFFSASIRLSPVMDRASQRLLMILQLITLVVFLWDRLACFFSYSIIKGIMYAELKTTRCDIKRDLLKSIRCNNVADNCTNYLATKKEK